MDADAQRQWRRRRRILATTAVLSVTAIPSLGQAAQSEAPSVATYTATAMVIVVATALFALLGLELVHRFRFIGGELLMRRKRQLRVFFGATFLLALVTPYVALNFSLGALVPFVATAGLAVAAWAWAASAGNGFDAEINSPRQV